MTAFTVVPFAGATTKLTTLTVGPEAGVNVVIVKSLSLNCTTPSIVTYDLTNFCTPLIVTYNSGICASVNS